MTLEEYEKKLFDLASECLTQGPGYAQETVVLREAMDRFGVDRDLKEQQKLLTAWHDLFHKGTLSWGYDIDNPSAPFFHVAER
ncbi:MAG: hypothetical protein WDZ51_02155 [Pirellulaceae bacterium]